MRSCNVCLRHVICTRWSCITCGIELLWIQFLWSWKPLHCCLWNAYSLLVLDQSHAVILVLTGLFSSISGQWQRISRGIQWVQRKPNRKIHYGTWNQENREANVEKCTGQPPSSYRSLVRGAGTMVHPFMYSPISIGNHMEGWGQTHALQQYACPIYYSPRGLQTFHLETPPSLPLFQVPVQLRWGNSKTHAGTQVSWIVLHQLACIQNIIMSDLELTK